MLLKLLVFLIHLSKRVRKWCTIKNVASWLLWIKRFIFMGVKRLLSRHKLSSLKVMAYLAALYQMMTHYTWWSGVYDSALLLLFHFRPMRYASETIMSSDGERYAVYTPKTQSSLYLHNSGVNKKKQHMWVCLPGGMQTTDPAMTALHSYGAFKGSKVCIFTNPGIGTKMNRQPLISPTEPKYVMEFIRQIQAEYNYDVSLIGFSIGTVQALRTLHTANNAEEDATNRISLKSVVLVHAPDIVRETIISNQRNWLMRPDVYFAFHVRWKHMMSGSWRMVKDYVSKSWIEGWPFIEEVTCVTLREPWINCESKYFNLRNFCDNSIESVPVMRIIAKNDFVIPVDSIDEKYFKHLKSVIITERGGHCAVNRSQQTMEAITQWNTDIVSKQEQENKKIGLANYLDLGHGYMAC